MFAQSAYTPEHESGGTPIPPTFTLGNLDDRESTNFVLLDITESTAHPAVIYERVRQVLADVGCPIPFITEVSYLFSDECGEEFFRVVLAPPVYLHFAFVLNDEGYYETLAELVEEPEVDSILNES
jgi:hypothetical protein